MPLSGAAHSGDLALIAQGLWGPNAVRAAAPGDAIDGILPRIVLEPSDAATVGAMLRWANVDGLRLVIRGAGSKLTWATPGTRVDAVLSTARLSSSIAHYDGDLTAVIAAGMPLSAANAVLRRSRQWLPLDPPTAHVATIGGVVATNDSGPRRHRFGTPRDLIIGVEMALADGRFAKGGGRVVKNVAGFDLARLLCGSFGTLAVIVNATFKLSPVAPASRTVVAELDDAGRIAEIAQAIAASTLVPSAVELELPPARMLIRFETVVTAAESQAAAAASLCDRHGARVTIIKDDDEAEVWRRYSADALTAADALVRVGVVPTAVGDALGAIERTTAANGIRYRVSGRAALAVLLVQLQGSVEACASAITEMRRLCAPTQGRVAVVASEPQLRALVDPWGPIGASFPIMRTLKQQFDPKQVLNLGRGPGGL